MAHAAMALAVVSNGRDAKAAVTLSANAAFTLSAKAAVTLPAHADMTLSADCDRRHHFDSCGIFHPFALRVPPVLPRVHFVAVVRRLVRAGLQRTGEYLAGDWAGTAYGGWENSFYGDWQRGQRFDVRGLRAWVEYLCGNLDCVHSER